MVHGWMRRVSCIREKKKRGNVHQPFYGAWVADFMLRQDAGWLMLGNYLIDQKSHGTEGDNWG